MVSKRADIKNPEVRQLADSIIAAQECEISAQGGTPETETSRALFSL
jgi:uncharacterized protein (DUF305 family)